MENYAAYVRPVIDRAYTSMRRGVHPSAVQVVERMGLKSPGFVWSFYFGLLARPMPAESFAAATTYSGGDMTEEVEQGIARVDADGTWHLTESGRELGLGVQLAIGEAAEEVWAERAGTLPRLADLLGRLLEAGAASGGPAFTALAPSYEPEGASPGVLVTSRMGALRHHRADAHRAAWQPTGLTVAELRALPADDPQRVEIERETNRRDAPIYGCLSDDERIEFMGLVGALPG